MAIPLEIDWLTLTTLVILFAAVSWFFQGHSELNSLRNLFFYAWFYYAMCVPLDILFGFKIGAQISGGVSLDNPYYHPDILFILLLYISCLIGFILGYKSTPTKPERHNSWSVKKISLPPIWLIVGINVIDIGVHVILFWSMSLLDLYRYGTQDFYIESIFLSSLVLAMNLYCIAISEDKKKARFFLIMGILSSILQRLRMNAIFYGCVYIMRHSSRQSAIRALIIICAAFLFVSTMKSVSSVMVDFITGKDSDLSVEIIEGLSRIEGSSSYLVATDIVSQSDSPLLLGKTYFNDTIKYLFPKFIRDYMNWPELTLSREWMRTRLPYADEALGYGFSAIAEAWMNFDFIGPVLLGILWGIFAKYFDSRPRNLGFIVFTVMTIRLFRSDFMGLFKNFTFKLWLSLLMLSIILPFLGSFNRGLESLHKGIGHKNRTH